jgi:dTDP-glucose 4,6-dehydratase
MAFWEGKKVLVTGAGGFAGSNLCRSLVDSGADVIAFVHSKDGVNLEGLEVKKVIGSILDKSSLQNAIKDVDTVFHVAAKVQISQTRDFPVETLDTNIIGTFNVASLAKENGVRRLVHISTCHVYGNQPENFLPITEDTVPRPHDVYAASKLASEIVLKPFVENGFDVVTTRAFNHYGPGQVGDFFVAKTIKQLLQKKNPVLGNPTPTRDYSYVRDITDGYVLVGEKGKKGEIYHLSSEKETSIGEMFSKIATACGIKNAEAKWTDFRKQDMSRSFGSSEKAKKDLGWKPRIGLEDGLKMTVDWWRTHPQLLKE